MLSNFGPMAQRLESLTGDYLGVPTRLVVSGDIGLTLTIAAMDLARGSTCLVVIHIQLHHQRDPLEWPSTGLRRHRSRRPHDGPGGCELGGG